MSTNCEATAGMAEPGGVGTIFSKKMPPTVEVSLATHLATNWTGPFEKGLLLKK
jgi:hypothetical protein